MSDEIPIGPNSCSHCGGEYGEHDEDCINKTKKKMTDLERQIAAKHNMSEAFNEGLERMQKLLTQRDEEIAELRKEILEMDSLIRTIGSRCTLYLVKKQGHYEVAAMSKDAKSS